MDRIGYEACRAAWARRSAGSAEIDAALLDVLHRNELSPENVGLCTARELAAVGIDARARASLVPYVAPPRVAMAFYHGRRPVEGTLSVVAHGPGAGYRVAFDGGGAAELTPDELDRLLRTGRVRSVG